MEFVPTNPTDHLSQFNEAEWEKINAGLVDASTKAEEALSQSGTSGLPLAPTATPGVLRIETVKKP